MPPEAAGVQVTPTSFVNVTKWTRTQTNRLLLEAGFGIYNQEYTDCISPASPVSTEKVWDAEAIRNARVYTVLDQSNNRIANAWNNPADHFSSSPHLSGRGVLRHRRRTRSGSAPRVSEGDWRLLEQWTGDMQPITYNAGRPVQVTLRLPTDRRNGIKADTGLFVQDRWTMSRADVEPGPTL